MLSVRFCICAVLMLIGLFFSITSVVGVYRFHYVLNRMHAAAMGDTLGILFAMLGLMVWNGLSWASLKLFLIILFFWLAAPVSSHLIGRLETATNEKIEEECEVDPDGVI